METKNELDYIFKVDNKAKATNTTVLYIVSGLVFFAAAFYFIAKQQNTMLILDIVAAIVYFWFLSKLKPSFFELIVTEQEIQINYYAIVIAGRSFQSFNFNLQQLRGFEIRRSFFGLRSELVVTVQTQYGLADFPPVGVTLLNAKELEQVAAILNTIIARNKHS